LKEFDLEKVRIKQNNTFQGGRISPGRDANPESISALWKGQSTLATVATNPIKTSI